MTTPVQETHVLSGSGGVRIHVRHWRLLKPRGQVLIVHGHGEHSGRYEAVAQRLCAEGWSVVAPDHRGHGQSDGGRGHCEAWAAYVGDLERVVASFIDPTLPLGVLGHSMGGLIAIPFALANQDKLRFLALSGPLLEVAVPVPPIKAFIGRLLSPLVPKLSLPTGLDAAHISRTAEVVEAYRNDPLVHGMASTRWYTEMIDAMAAAHRQAPDLRIPVLVFHGESDQLTGIEGSRRFYSKLTTDERLLKTWPGLYHEILNEPEGPQVLNEIIDWARPFMKA
jgi:alpha-beta hydrolase superfamily lysophospholipase